MSDATTDAGPSDQAPATFEQNNLRFESDYQVKPHPLVVQAFAAACGRDESSTYGSDMLTNEGSLALFSICRQMDNAVFVQSGTAANILAIEALKRFKGEGVICATTSHLATSEGGGLAHGCPLIPIDTSDGKLTPDLIRTTLSQRGEVRAPYPGIISIANPTETGTLYSQWELNQLVRCATSEGCGLHIDGARWFFAEAAGSHLPDFRDIERVAITIGATKCGGIQADAVMTRLPYAGDAARELLQRLQAQHGHLAARTHLQAAQFLALFEDGLGARLASHANKMAALLGSKLKEQAGIDPAYKVETNAVFCRLPERAIRLLRRHASFYVCYPHNNLVRFMTSWGTSEEDVAKLVGHLVKALA